ncbi:MAG: hypothetical protein KDJ65_02395 [Anaerolineae bacterium]|nr:hypothetical protein [Anaerolineae bacterium]
MVRTGTRPYLNQPFDFYHSCFEHNFRGLEALSGSDPVIENSQFFNTQNLAVFNDSPAVLVDARLNWWGDASGPFHPTLNPTGVGDQVSDGVLFEPWLESPPVFIDPDSIIPLALGTEYAMTLAPSDRHYFEIQTAAGNNLLITLDDIAEDVPISPSSAPVQIFVAAGRYPSPDNHDDFAEASVSNPSVAIPFAPTIAGKYYVLVQAPQLTDGSLEATIQADYTTELQLTSVSPNQVSNAGNSTIQIKGTGLTSGATVEMISPSGQRTAASDYVFVSEAELFATFNLQGAATGSYAIEVKRPTDNAVATLQNAIDVGLGSGGKLEVSLEGPQVVRPGRIYRYNLVYENVGGADLPAPFLSVTASDSSTKFIIDGSPPSDVLIWIAPGNASPGNVLPPGQGGVIPFLVSTEQDAEIVASQVLESDSLFDWDFIKQRLTPEGVPDSQWDSSWNSAIDQLGNTRQEVFGILRELNTYHSRPADLDSLIRFALFLASQNEPSTSLMSPHVFKEQSIIFATATYQAEDDVKLLDAFGSLIVGPTNGPPRDPGAFFDPNKKTIVVTHGWKSNEDSQRFEDIAIALQSVYPDRNVIRVIWKQGASTPPSLRISNS